MGRYWIALSHSSSTHCRYFKQPALHHRGVGASCPSLPSGLGHSHAQRLTDYTLSCHTTSTLATCGRVLGLLYPKSTCRVSLNQCRGVWQR
ncbi:hypothetical protein TNCV_4786271 [Trichonephila clavipes]|nr:hypothetical protein TNCV_4786271 [Trichonephila clavipes]